jgi:hypothetical protein
MNQIDSSIWVAIIAALAALVGSISSIITSFSTAKKLQKIEGKKVIFEHLNKKVQDLDKARNELRDSWKSNPSEKFSKEAMLRHVMKAYEVATEILEKIKHLLPKDVAHDLSEDVRKVGERRALMLREQLGPPPSGRKIPQGVNPVSDDDFISLMMGFPKKMLNALEDELANTIRRIED